MFLLTEQQNSRTKKLLGHNASKVGGVFAGILALKLLSLIVNRDK